MHSEIPTWWVNFVTKRPTELALRLKLFQAENNGKGGSISDELYPLPIIVSKRRLRNLTTLHHILRTQELYTSFAEHLQYEVAEGIGMMQTAVIALNNAVRNARSS